MKGDCTPFSRVCVGIGLSSCVWISVFSFNRLSLHNTDFNAFQRKRDATEFVAFWAIPNSREDTTSPSFTPTDHRSACSLSVAFTLIRFASPLSISLSCSSKLSLESPSHNKESSTTPNTLQRHLTKKNDNHWASRNHWTCQNARIVVSTRWLILLKECLLSPAWPPSLWTRFALPSPTSPSLPPTLLWDTEWAVWRD